jgi:3-ketoacyl-CoA synthase
VLQAPCCFVSSKHEWHAKHVCSHHIKRCVTPAGGAKVLDGIGKELQLDEAAMKPSRMVLHDYGNVSSSTTWYTLGYVESVRGAKKGE